MANRWFRFYDEALDDPKVQRLSPVLFKTWINVLCAASRHSGVVTNITDLAFMLRREEVNLADEIQLLIEAGLIDEARGKLMPHNWNGRQFQSDASTDRVQRFRNKKPLKPRNVSETADVTPPDTEQSRTETENKISHPSDARPPNEISDDALAQEAVKVFNAVGSVAGWPLAQRLTKQRRAAVLSRLRECGGLEGWHAAMERARSSAFLCGSTGWKADFDFFCQSKSFTKLMEGSYDDHKPSPEGGRNGKPSAHETVLRSIARAVEARTGMGGGEADSDGWNSDPRGLSPSTSGVADDLEIPTFLRRQ